MERRQQPRKSIQRKVYFICVSTDGREQTQDIGVARDISTSGMMIETTTPINTREIRIISSTPDNQQIEANAGVIYSMQVGEDRYNTGIFFQGDSEKTESFIEQFMLACDAGK